MAQFKFSVDAYVLELFSASVLAPLESERIQDYNCHVIDVCACRLAFRPTGTSVQVIGPGVLLMYRTHTQSCLSVRNNKTTRLGKSILVFGS